MNVPVQSGILKMFTKNACGTEILNFIDALIKLINYVIQFSILEVFCVPRKSVEF